MNKWEEQEETSIGQRPTLGENYWTSTCIHECSQCPRSKQSIIIEESDMFHIFQQIYSCFEIFQFYFKDYICTFVSFKNIYLVECIILGHN